MTDKTELLKKLLELASRGVGGEAENARKMAEAIAKKYGIEINEYRKIATPKLNASKRDIMAVATTMCGCLLFKNGYYWYILGKHVDLAIDCYYYLCSLLPTEFRKNSKYIHSFAAGLRERLQDEPGWVDNIREINLISETLGCKVSERSVKGDARGYDQAKKVSLRRQTRGSGPKLLTY